MNTKEVALSYAQDRCIREQEKMWVYREKNEPDHYLVSPVKQEGSYVTLVKVFEPDEIDDQEFEKKVIPISNYKTLKEGDHVLVNGHPEKIKRITARQIVTNIGNKFRKSDGVEWGVDDEADALRITEKIEI